MKALTLASAAMAVQAVTINSSEQRKMVNPADRVRVTDQLVCNVDKKIKALKSRYL